MKKNTRLFFRTVYISSVVLACAIIGFAGISRAYENIRLIGFGEYRDAIEITDEAIKIFDFEIKK